MVNDLKGNRIREIKGKVIEKIDVKNFNVKYPEHKGLQKEDILKVVKVFNAKIISETINNIYGVSLPQNIGVVSIVNKGPSEKRPIDFKNSLKEGRVIRYRNWDTDNNIMGIRFSHSGKGLQPKNMKLFGFTAIRQFKREASKYFKKNWQRCLFITKPL